MVSRSQFLLLLFLYVSFFSEMEPQKKENRFHNSYEKEITEWNETRIKNLKREFDWLSLVALDWLNEGENEIKNVGTLILKNENVSLKLKNGIHATLNGNEFTSGKINDDQSKNGADTIKFGSRAFIIIKRGGKFALRMWDKEIEERNIFTTIERFPLLKKWKIEARWKAYNPPKKIIVPTVISGYEEEYPVPGAAIFFVDGKEYKLEPVLEEENGDYFYIFSDKTNGKETYSAGRFLYSEREKNGTIILDFNKAYNPPCAFTPYATCPLPPKSNRLSIRIEAGEKNYKKH